VAKNAIKVSVSEIQDVKVEGLGDERTRAEQHLNIQYD